MDLDLTNLSSLGNPESKGPHLVLPEDTFNQGSGDLIYSLLLAPIFQPAPENGHSGSFHVNFHILYPQHPEIKFLLLLSPTVSLP